MTPLKFASIKLASHKIAALRFALLRFALLILALIMVAPLRSASCKYVHSNNASFSFVLTILAPIRMDLLQNLRSKFASVKLTLLIFISDKSTPNKSALRRSLPVKSIGGSLCPSLVFPTKLLSFKNVINIPFLLLSKLLIAVTVRDFAMSRTSWSFVSLNFFSNKRYEILS